MQSLSCRYHAQTFVPRLRYINLLQTATFAFSSFINYNRVVHSNSVRSIVNHFSHCATSSHMSVHPVNQVVVEGHPRQFRSHRKPSVTAAFAVPMRWSSKVLLSKDQHTHIWFPVYIASSNKVHPFLSSVRIGLVVGRVCSSAICGKNSFG